LAQRLVAEGEPVLDVPARLSARVRALGGGSGRKTDDADAFAVAVAGILARELQLVRRDDIIEILRMLSTRRQEVVALRIATVNRLHEVLCQLIPGGAQRHLSATKARPLLAAVRPRDAVGKARKQLALDYAAELARLAARLKELKKNIAQLLAEHPTTLLQINGVGPINAAKILAEVGDVRRFPSRGHFASYTGTAPIDVSSGDNNRHRLNRGGNRRLNHALHIAAVVQYRMPGPRQDYYRRKRDQGKTHLEALRCLKRRLSDAVHRHLVHDLAACDRSRFLLSGQACSGGQGVGAAARETRDVVNRPGRRRLRGQHPVAACGDHPRWASDPTRRMCDPRRFLDFGVGSRIGLHGVVGYGRVRDVRVRVPPKVAMSTSSAPNGRSPPELDNCGVARRAHRSEETLSPPALTSDRGAKRPCPTFGQRFLTVGSAPRDAMEAPAGVPHLESGDHVIAGTTARSAA
jgi:transposase